MCCAKRSSRFEIQTVTVKFEIINNYKFLLNIFIKKSVVEKILCVIRAQCHCRSGEIAVLRNASRVYILARSGNISLCAPNY